MPTVVRGSDTRYIVECSGEGCVKNVVGVKEEG